MKLSEKYFLAVAETLNISQTAKDYFISQQDLSRHIRRLESELGVSLFYRTPRLSLSPYGEVLKKSLERIRIIEQGVMQQFQEIHEGATGTINLGMHFTRSRIILPKVYTRFNPEFPNVSISIFNEETSRLQQMVLQGKLDVMLGVNPEIQHGLQEEHICTENIFYLISESLLRNHFGDQADAVIEKCYKNGADMRLFQSIPFVSNQPNSQAQKLLSESLRLQGIRLNTLLATTDHDGNIALVAEGNIACCCPQSILWSAELINKNMKKANQLHAFLVRGIDPCLRLSLLYSKNAYVPRYLQAFIQCVSDEARNISIRYKNGI